jgi:hypothetical protein
MGSSREVTNSRCEYYAENRPLETAIADIVPRLRIDLARRPREQEAAGARLMA